MTLTSANKLSVSPVCADTRTSIFHDACVVRMRNILPAQTIFFQVVDGFAECVGMLTEDWNYLSFSHTNVVLESGMNAETANTNPDIVEPVKGIPQPPTSSLSADMSVCLTLTYQTDINLICQTSKIPCPTLLSDMHA